MIKICDGMKSFKDLCVFDHLNLDIHEPGLYIIEGESGSGKSTLLNLLAGYDSFDEGTYEIDSNIATIFQNYELIDELNVKENIFLEKEDITEEDRMMIDMLGIWDLMDHYPREISGGQKQRVGIARALLLHPSIILCDEPTESLDIDNKRIVMQLLKKLSLERIVLVATHDRKMIEEYADCILQLKNRKIERLTVYQSKNELKKMDADQKDDHQISKLIHKIVRKKTIAASLLMALLMVVIQQLFVYQKGLFFIPKTHESVNADVLYLELNAAHTALYNFGFQDDKLTPTIKFLNVFVEDESVLADIYPYEPNELSIEGKAPSKDEILINQNLAKRIGNWENLTLDCTYNVGGVKSVKTFRISGVVNESDSQLLSAYYDLDALIFELSMGDTETYTRDLLNNGSVFKMSVPYDEIESYYTKLKDSTMIIPYNSLYEQREQFKLNASIYQMLFHLFEGFLIGGLMIFVILYLYRDTKHYLGICSILASLQFSLHKIKTTYLKEKLLTFLKALVGSELIFVIIQLIFFDWKNYMQKSDMYILCAIPVGLVALYLLTLLVCIRQLKMNRISDILKENKDS